MKHHNETHGMSKRKIYAVWRSMKSRCKNANRKDYSNYGQRGIEYDSSWETFDNFYTDMGLTYQIGLQLDRIDSNKGYTKDNCKWSTPKEQANNKRNNRLVTINGITHTLMEWSEISGIKYHTLSKRLHKYKWNSNDLLKSTK